MRTAVPVLMLCCAVSTTGTAPAMAQEYPFCIKGGDFGGGRGDCSFATYQQCQATVSGRNGYCDANPYFNANTEPPDRSRLSRRRF
jgi:uncharacterized protein DUF3551